MHAAVGSLSGPVIASVGAPRHVIVVVLVDAVHAARVVVELDACVRKGEIGRLSRFVVDAHARRS